NAQTSTGQGRRVGSSGAVFCHFTGLVLEPPILVLSSLAENRTVLRLRLSQHGVLHPALFEPGLSRCVNIRALGLHGAELEVRDFPAVVSVAARIRVVAQRRRSDGRGWPNSAARSA